MTDQTEALATLDQLAALGMDLARAITAQGLESGDPASVASAFARVSRSVRQTILLKDRLTKGITYDRSQRRMRGKMQLEDALNDIIDQEARDSLDYERLHAEAAERLEFEDDDPILDLPLPEAINVLRAAIGLEALPLDGEGLGWGGGATLRDQARNALPTAAIGAAPGASSPTLPFLHRGGRVADCPSTGEECDQADAPDRDVPS